MSNKWWPQQPQQPLHLPTPSTPTQPPPKPNPNPNPPSHHPGPRRSPSSSNSNSKPKPPHLLSYESPSSLHTHLLHLPSGTDISLSLSLFSRHHHLSLSILSATGSISSTTLLLPSTSSPLLLHGHFQLLSLSGSFFPGPSPPLTVYLTGPHGQLIAGTVIGSLVSSGPVIILAATSSTPSFDHLPLQDNDDDDVAGAVSGDLPDYSPPPPPLPPSLPLDAMQVGHASLPWFLPRPPF
ncbi:AF0104/ALDC/Ptd012-like protein [Dioscorea alata]|uniref:AF0104/ALDC/Ptd012-like protein n=1 Tax=Dioscorea alata TaxID=55571 RepID=A0ACB7UQI2_DIOAL|nr:AF0104/ALDC/Ptd012-like protein [Dioscorea alata]